MSSEKWDMFPTSFPRYKFITCIFNTTGDPDNILKVYISGYDLNIVQVDEKNNKLIPITEDTVIKSIPDAPPNPPVIQLPIKNNYWSYYTVEDEINYIRFYYNKSLNQCYSSFPHYALYYLTSNLKSNCPLK